MARTRKTEYSPKPFVLQEPIKRANYPAARARQELAENSGYVAVTLDQLRKGLFMPKVNSNRELMERIEQYFDVCSQSETIPTVAGLCLYCGYSHYQFSAWRTGREKFKDEAGVPSTHDIIKQASSVLLGLDEAMASAGKQNVVAYIFKSSNYHGLVQKNTVSIDQQPEQPETMSRDEIQSIAAAIAEANEME